MLNQESQLYGKTDEEICDYIFYGFTDNEIDEMRKRPVLFSLSILEEGIVEQSDIPTVTRILLTK
jgi:hypothetical protein